MLLHFHEIIRNLGRDIGLDSSDVTYLIGRYESESIKFLTSTLPKLWKAVMNGFKIGYLRRNHPSFSLTAFAWKSRSLRYFSSLLDKIFDPGTGLLLEQPCAKTVRKLRYLCEYVYKLSFAFSDKEQELAFEKYHAFQKSLSEKWKLVDQQFVEKMRKNFETHYHDVSKAHPHEVYEFSRPRFGPGQVNLGAVRAEQKDAMYEYMGIPKDAGVTIPAHRWKNAPIHLRGLCDRSFKAFSGFFKPYPGMKLKYQSSYYTDQRRLAQVVLVPKNADGPRVITMEPPEFIRAQMPFFDWASRTLERVTAGRIQFYDQSVNRALAQKGSSDGSLATIDLKEASDSVQLNLCLKLFRNSPAIRWFIKNTRSSHAQTGRGLHARRVRLDMLSGMGSGLTFPIMSLVIHLAVCTQVQLETGLRYAEVSRQVYTFGDDLVVPTVWAEAAQMGLAKAGLRINPLKSFWSGPFRESCGGDYINGVDCAPKRLKLSSADLEKPTGGPRPVVIQSKDAWLVVKHCHELEEHGMWNLQEYLYQRAESELGPLPYIMAGSPVLGRLTSHIGDISPFAAKHWVIQPETDKWSKQDPYTYLGRVLKPTPDKGLYVPRDGVLFEQLAVSRMVKLKKQLVRVETLTGQPRAEIPLPSSRTFSVEREAPKPVRKWLAWILNNIEFVELFMLSALIATLVFAFSS